MQPERHHLRHGEVAVFAPDPLDELERGSVEVDVEAEAASGLAGLHRGEGAVQGLVAGPVAFGPRPFGDHAVAADRQAPRIREVRQPVPLRDRRPGADDAAAERQRDHGRRVARRRRVDEPFPFSSPAHRSTRRSPLSS